MKRYFQNEGREYVLEDFNAPRPLQNYSWNPGFLSAFNHVATGHGLYCDKTTITATYIDLRGRVRLINDGNRFFYLRDAESKTVWNIAGYPAETKPERYRCTMGLGYSIYESKLNEIECRSRVFVNRTDPCEIWTLELTNQSDRLRYIQLFPAVEWSLEGYTPKSDYFSYLSTEVDREQTVLYAYNQADERQHDHYNGFMAADHPFNSFDTSLVAFLGTYGSFVYPQALKNGRCSDTIGTSERLAAAMEIKLKLLPGQTERVQVLIGSFEKKEEVTALCGRLFAEGAVERCFEGLNAEKEQRTQALRIETPDERINALFNTWTKQQVVLCSEVGRGNSRGYRDVLQDAWGYVAFDAVASRRKIEEALSHQYADGHAPRGWLPLDERHYSDSPVWIPLAVNGYLKETGNLDFLETELPYLDGEKGTVWDHCLRAVNYLYGDRGSHELVLAHMGDWNDSLTGLGSGGKGESVWTTIALHYALLETAEIAKVSGKSATLIELLNSRADELCRIVNQTGWDGDWYLEGYDDNGRPVGSSAETEGRIYLNPQTWAVIARTASLERAKHVMDEVENQLDCPYGSLTLTPAYTAAQPAIGRLTEFVPGIWENGCPYCHGSAFKIVADCLLGRGDQAYATLSKVIPDHPDNPMEQSGCEPYAFTNMYLGPQHPRAGTAIFGWISGTAGWMFRAVTQHMMGFYPDYHGFELRPCLPAAWSECRIQRLFRKNTYDIHILNPEHCQSGVKRIELDGVVLDSRFVPYQEDGGRHKITVWMGQ